MINLNWEFTKDYVALGDKRFLYTTKNGIYLKEHLKAEKVIRDIQMGDLNIEIIKEPINNIEWEIIQTALNFFDWDITLEDLENTDLEYYISEMLPYEFFEDVYKHLKDEYDDCQHSKKEMDTFYNPTSKDLVDDNYYEFKRLVLDVCEYNANRYEIIEQLGYNPDELNDIADKEYENNLYYYIINQNRLLKALENIYTYMWENLLNLESINKIKKKEKKNIVQLLSCVDSLQTLSSYSFYKKKEKKPKKLKSKKIKLPQKCYIIKDKNTGFYKIGKSINPKNREKTLQAEKPTIKLIKIFNKDYELYLHEKYKEQRVRGEWFNLSKLQVNYICRQLK